MKLWVILVILIQVAVIIEAPQNMDEGDASDLHGTDSRKHVEATQKHHNGNSLKRTKKGKQGSTRIKKCHLDHLSTLIARNMSEGDHSARNLHRKHLKKHVKGNCSMGMFLLSSNIVSRLLQMQYQYLFLSQHYQSAVNYHPNVAEYFRRFSTDRGKILDEVTKYIMAKQVTEDLLNSISTDYVNVMMSLGFRDGIVANVNVTDHMTSSFAHAKVMETELGRELAAISLHAERNQDHELSQFVAGDLLPRVTIVTNKHTNHLRTTLRPADVTPERYLVEFMFDKYLTM